MNDAIGLHDISNCHRGDAAILVRERYFADAAAVRGKSEVVFILVTPYLHAQSRADGVTPSLTTSFARPHRAVAVERRGQLNDFQ
jgi:hypothetical protein